MFQFNNATTNGSQLSATTIGAQSAMAPLGTVSANVGGGVQGANVTAASAPGTNPAATGGGFFRNQDGSFNADNMGLVLGGIQTLGSLWNSYQQQKIAKEQLGLARETFETNLRNNTRTYNTALEDRIRARHHTEGRNSAETDSYIAQNSL